MKIHYLLLTVLVTGLFACQNTSKTALKSLDLLQHGIPITIMAPDSAKVVAGSLSFSQDVTVKSPTDNYDVQIFAYDATTTDTVSYTHLTLPTTPYV